MSVINLSDLVPKNYLTGEVGQVINDNGTLKVQPLSFIEETPSSNGNPELFVLKSFNSINDNPYKRRLAYLESTGTQYIDAGIIPSENTEIEVECRGQLNIGCRTSYSVNEFRVSASNTVIDCAFGTSLIRIDNKNINEKTKIKFGTDGKFYHNDTLIYESSDTISSPFNNIYIMAVNSGGTPVLEGIINSYVYNVKIRENNVLIMDLIPVMDKNDIPCMYDKITNQLFYNHGTEQFLYGELS